ncbi:MAG: UTP--glucose-1-phosphate uridylyltransferase GalU [Gammaproteobacteria bacterium]|nr:UTP--glucose-1-phosphate uridylyltransferase GalU [Gammaproteobacteria bacterium]
MPDVLIKKCLFPAAGYGTRFLPATKSIPKEMIPVVNNPLIQYGVEEAMAAGIDSMAIITSAGKEALKNYFELNEKFEQQLADGKQLDQIRHIIETCNFSFAIQEEMKGLGHAILTGAQLIGDDPFAVILPDDLCYAPEQGVLSQMVDLYMKHQCSIVAIEEVPQEETNRYGIIAGDEIEPGLIRITDMVEKPDPAQAPSNLAIIGRYILTPDIFDIIRDTPPGRNDEIQITDALLTQVKQSGGVLGYKFNGRRFDCGTPPGFLEASNFYFENQLY